MFQNIETLQKLMGTKDLPPLVLKLYSQTVRLWHKVANGPLSNETLLLIVVGAQILNEKAKSDWRAVPANTPVVTSDGREGFFAGLNRQGKILLRYKGNKNRHTVSADSVRLAEPPEET